MENFTLHNFKNVDETVISLVNTILSLFTENKPTEAYAKIKENEPLLSQYFVDSGWFNSIEEAILFLEKLAFKKKQTFYIQSDYPDTMNTGDILFKIPQEV